MKRDVGILICVFLSLCAGAKTVMKDGSDNPYQNVAARNVFRLKPILQLELSKPVPPPPAKARLTGITDIPGRELALFLVEEAQPGRPTRQVSYILAAGQCEGPLEVLEIDGKAGSARIKNSGVAQTLNFEKDGVKLPNSSPPAARTVLRAIPPGQPGGPATQPQPTITPDEQIIMMEVERDRNKNNPGYPPLPPTPLMPQPLNTSVLPR